MSTAQNRRILLVDDMSTIHSDFRKILAADNDTHAELSACEASLFGEEAAGTEPTFELDSAYQERFGRRLVRTAGPGGAELPRKGLLLVVSG